MARELNAKRRIKNIIPGFEGRVNSLKKYTPVVCIFSSAFPSIFHCLRGGFSLATTIFIAASGITGIPFGLPTCKILSLRIFRQVIRHLFRLIDVNPSSTASPLARGPGSKIFGFSRSTSPRRDEFSGGGSRKSRFD